jgi:hypothetical protein
MSVGWFLQKHLIINSIIYKVIDNLNNITFIYFVKQGKEPTCIVISSIQKTSKTQDMGWVLSFQILITYLDDWHFIQVGYES